MLFLKVISYLHTKCTPQSALNGIRICNTGLGGKPFSDAKRERKCLYAVLSLSPKFTKTDRTSTLQSAFQDMHEAENRFGPSLSSKINLFKYLFFSFILFHVSQVTFSGLGTNVRRQSSYSSSPYPYPPLLSHPKHPKIFEFNTYLLLFFQHASSEKKPFYYSSPGRLSSFVCPHS